MTSVATKTTTRRKFLKMAAIGGAGLAVLPLVGDLTAEASDWAPNAKWMVIQDSSRCIGCKRCEVACSLTHDNKISPNTSRIKVTRNWAYGPEGPKAGAKASGMFGDFRIIADTCLQCPHPVPCLTACPNGAIEVDAKTGARVINNEKCKGCGICQKACPHAMTSLDSDTHKATKCDLCGGDPECVKICPAGALRMVPWRDRTRETQPRQGVAAVDSSCNSCHQG
jgi:Fe-S-cluster-containing dehydrogenase component